MKIILYRKREIKFSRIISRLEFAELFQYRIIMGIIKFVYFNESIVSI